MKVLRAVALYLKDWRNWLTHSLIGIGILLIAFHMPVKPVYRISLIVVVVTFNTIRMKLNKQFDKEAVEEIN
ncbi:MAG: hypothetical protein ABFC94_18600 [Syntrophomonas sp.]